MRHKMGWPTRCTECFHYTPKPIEEKGNHDGYCRLGLKINNKKVSKAPAKVQAFYGQHCDDWEDAENRLTYFEVMTRTVGEWRTPMERIAFEKILKGES